MDDNLFSGKINRRNFLKLGGLLTVSLLSQGIPGWAAKSFSEMNPAAPPAQKLVVVFLRGAADALSIVVPYGDPNYYELRTTTALPQPGQAGGVLPLDPLFGLNPNLEDLMPFWQQKQVGFVINSGSKDPSRSHFEAQDFMESGTPGLNSTDTGWLNRALQVLPSSHSPTRALNVGPTLPRILQGPIASANVPTQANTSANGIIDRPVVSEAFQAMYGTTDPLGKALQEGIAARRSVADSLNQEMVMANQGAPAASGFELSGSRIAKLINTDPTVQTVFVALGGWDTHVNQGSSQGQLARQLQGLGKGLGTMMRDLQTSGELANTQIVVISEFGRTAHENGNGGTDHGHGNVMWLLGGGINGRNISGHWNGLSKDNLNEGRDLPVNTDFRAVLNDLFTSRYRMTEAQRHQIFPTFTPTPGTSLFHTVNT